MNRKKVFVEITNEQIYKKLLDIETEMSYSKVELSFQKKMIYGLYATLIPTVGWLFSCILKP